MLKMKFCRPQLILAFAVFTAGWVLPVSAQTPIIFSKPMENGTAEKANSFLNTEPSHRAPNSLNAPAPIFGPRNSATSYDILPGANQIQRQISPAELKAWEKILEGKKKWAMMTPEEIMGVPTAEKILGIPEKDEDAKLTIEQRYLKRQQRAATFAATNGYRGPDLKPRDPNNPLAKNNDPFHQENLFLRPADEQRQLPNEPPKLFNDVFGLNPKAALTPQQRQESAWGNTFDLPPQPAKQTPEQLAGMDRFRAMMEPSAALEKSLPAARTPLPVAKTESTPLFNPLGGSAKAVRNEASRAKGIAPLPSLIRQPVVTPPAAITQLPPWLRDDDGVPKPKVGRF